MTAVFLDLDGTLMDSRPGILSSLTAAFREIGRLDLAETDLTWMIGPPFETSFREIGIDDPQMAIDAYRRHYDTGGMFDAKVYDGVTSMLAHLTDGPFRTYLATAKPIVSARKITRHFGLSTALHQEFGPELDGTRSWKGDLLAHALEVTGEDPANSVMVGDRHHDISAAKSVGMPSIAVRWGYGEPHEWEDAHGVIDTPTDLVEAINALGSGHQ